MTASIFREYVAKYLRPTVARIYELINGKPEGSQPKLLHKVMLTEEHTTKDSWDGPSISRCSVSVGDVPMVSSIPLNSRISFWGATSIPKFTIAYRKKESDIKDLQVAIALGNSEAQVAEMLTSVLRALRLIRKSSSCEVSLRGLRLYLMRIAMGSTFV